MNIETIFSDAAKLMLIVAAICTLVTVITEFTKDIGLLSKIPTKLQVLVMMQMVCIIVMLAYLSYTGILFRWYYLAATIFVAFILAYVCCNGWEYLADIWRRFYKDYFSKLWKQIRGGKE